MRNALVIIVRNLFLFDFLETIHKCEKLKIKIWCLK